MNIQQSSCQFLTRSQNLVFHKFEKLRKPRKTRISSIWTFVLAVLSKYQIFEKPLWSFETRQKIHTSFWGIMTEVWGWIVIYSLRISVNFLVLTSFKDYWEDLVVLVCNLESWIVMHLECSSGDIISVWYIKNWWDWRISSDAYLSKDDWSEKFMNLFSIITITLFEDP